MNEIKTGEHDFITLLLTLVSPGSFLGAIVYFVLFVLLAMLVSRLLRRAVHASMIRKGHVDLTTISFLQQFGSAVTWVVALILYAHLIPVLRSMGTALLTGVSIASVVIGLALQSTLGNLVAGIAITIYKPFRLGDTLQVAAPTGTEIGIVDSISLGYTTLRSPAGHLIVLPNALAASSTLLNLNPTFAPWPLTVAINLPRNVDIEAARALALQVAHETKAKQVTGCYLTKVEANSVTLELRLHAADIASRDTLKSELLARLSQRFAATPDLGVGAGSGGGGAGAGSTVAGAAATFS
jgi:small-conductance mechanosensitive channel